MMIDYPKSEQIPQLRQLWKDAFGDDDVFLDRFFSLAYSPQRCLCALDGDRVTGALYWLPCRRGAEQFAYIYAVATHPDHRGKGICRNLMAAAHAILAEDGYLGTLLYPQDEGLRLMYRSMGYQDATTITEGICALGTAPVPLHPVTWEEYLRLRPEYLPANSVAQEELFLQLMAPDFRFFKGLGFLLTARQEADHLFIPELLGDVQSVPGILCALGMSWARFRTPGSKLPFAMFHPLAEGVLPPAYFAFPLD